MRKVGRPSWTAFERVQCSKALKVWPSRLSMESTLHYARHCIKHKLCRKLAANWQNIKHKLNSYNNSVVRNWQQVGRILAAHGRSYACLSQRNPTLEVSSHGFSVSRTEQLNDKSHED